MPARARCSPGECLHRAVAASASLEAGLAFLASEARVLERRLSQVCFRGADPGAAMTALLAYRNDDGGFGYGLEPDKRTAASQPLDVEVAFSVMELLGPPDTAVVISACDFLASIGPGVGCLTADALEGPRAPHWGEFALGASLNPTAGLAASLLSLEVDHPWREAATAFCLERLELGLPDDAHAFAEVLRLLDALPESRWPCATEQLVQAVENLSLFLPLPVAGEYGLTPLHLAPSPDSRWLELFASEAVERHLDALAGAQLTDGGWPIAWESCGPAALQEWRGIETLRALRTLEAYGRLSA